MPRVLIAIPEGNEEWSGLETGDTYEATVLLTKQEDGSGLVSEVDGVAIPMEEEAEAEEEMAEDAEEDFLEGMDAEME